MMKATPLKLSKPIFAFVFSAVIFALLNILFKNIQFFPNYVDFRISAFFPVTSGLLFGPAGALGCAAGNLISDFFGTLNYESPLGMLAYFLFAWIPYRLWHTMLPFENHKLQFISSTKTLVKYILIASFSVLSSMAVLAAGCDLFGAFNFSEFFKPVLLCNLYFALFWGTTVFLLASKLMPEAAHIPEKLYICEYCHKRYLPDYLICLIVSLAVLIRYIVSENSNDMGVFPFALNLVILAGSLLLAFLPLRRSRKPSDNTKADMEKSTGLQSQIITGFFVVISVSTVFLVLLLFYNLHGFLNDEAYSLHLIQYSFKMVNIFGFAFILVLIVILMWIERKITKPVINLAEISNKFVENGLRAEIPDYGKLSDEISVPEQTYRKMSADIESYVSTIEAHAKREEYARLMLEMADQYGFDDEQRQMLSELLADENNSLWSQVLYGISVGDGEIVTVALSQVGNIGGQPYWSWYGFNSRVEWCANECGYIENGVIPKFAGCIQGSEWFMESGQWQDGSFTPEAGHIIFFDWEGDGETDHVGIVERVENGTVYTVEGNSGDACRQNSYAVGSSVIYGYGIPAY